MIRLYSCDSPLSGLDHCLAALARHQKEHRDKRAFLLVPEEAKADSERRYLERFDRTGLMMAEVLSFRRFAHRIFSEAGGLSRKRIGDNGKALLICRLLQTEQEDFPVLGRLAGKGDYAAELSQILGDFNRYCVSADALAELSETGQNLPELTKRKIKDLALLKERFDGLKHANGWVDSDEDFPRLCRLLTEEADHPRLSFLKESSIFVAGFGILRSFTPQELELLRVLGAKVKDLSIAVSDRPEAEEGASIGKQTRLNLERLFPHASVISLGQTERKGAQVECRISADRSAEAAACAGEIRRMLLSGGLRRKDIAVAYCREEDRKLLAEVFREFGIDPYSTAKSPLDESSLLRYMEAFFSLADEGRPEDLLSLAHSGVPDLPAEDLDRFDNFLAASGCRFLSQLESEKLYLRRPLEGTAARSFYINYLQGSVKAAAKLRAIPGSAEKARFLLEWLDQESRIRERLEELAQFHYKRGLTDAATLLALSWTQLLELLEDCVTLMGDSQISAGDFGELILSALRHKTPASIPLGLDRVRVGRPEQLLLTPCKVLFILGATSSTFPPGAPGEGLLQNVERQWIEEESGLELPNYRRDSVPAGQALVLRLSNLPTERLIVSCPSPESWERSALQRKLETRDDVSKKSFTDYSLPDARWLAPERARRYLEESVRFPGKAVWNDLLTEKEADQKLVSLLSDPLYLSESPRLILPHLLTDEDRKFSISRLQTYSRCPYQYFASYGLCLKERDVFEPHMGNSGSFLHGMMEKAFLDLMQGMRETSNPAAYLDAWKGQLDREYIRRIYREVAGEAGHTRFAEAELRGGSGRLLCRQAEDSLRFGAGQLAADGFLPHVLEWYFPAAGTGEPLKLRAGGRELQFSGIIDRVDFDQGNQLYRIVDYKSGQAKNRPAELLAGWQLQLPLYSKIWQHSHPGQKPDSLALHKLSEDPQQLIDGFAALNKLRESPVTDKKADEIAGEELDLYTEYAWAVSGHLLEKMDRGVISPEPMNVAEKRPCDYCEYRDLCRMDARSIRRRERKLTGAETKQGIEALFEEWKDSGCFPEGV